MPFATGCRNHCRNPGGDGQFRPPPPPFGEYHLPGFSWGNVCRVLLLPVHNESQYTLAGEELRRSLSAELQQLGRFEVVAPPPDYPAFQSEFIHVHGRFDEAEMLELSHIFAADVIVHTSVTHYSPYQRPRVGLVVTAVSARDAKVVSTVDGMWDTADLNLTQRIRGFYAAPRERPIVELVRGVPLPAQDGHAEEIALESPRLFQRFICHEVVEHLISNPSQTQASAATPAPANGALEQLPMPNPVAPRNPPAAVRPNILPDGR